MGVIIFFSTILVLTIGLFIFSFFYTIYSLEHYKPKTIEEIKKSKELQEHFEVEENKYYLEDYGLKTKKFFIKLNNLELFSEISLPEKPSKRCLVFVHGRESNHVRVLKYVNILKQCNFHKENYIAVLDLRNSGESTPSKVTFGYNEYKDLETILEYLHKTYFIDEFILWGFSMGAMVIGRFLKKSYPKYKNDFKISKIILDSPLSNTKKTIEFILNKKFKIPEIGNFYTYLYNKIRKNYLDGLRLSVLYKNFDGDVYIIASEEDNVTPFKYLKKELDILDDKKHFHLYVFSKGAHVKIYSENKKEYTNLIKDILCSNVK